MKNALDFIVNILKNLILKIQERLRMNALRRVEASRKEWRTKARLRATEIRELRKARIKYKQKIHNQAAEITALRDKLKKKN